MRSALVFLAVAIGESVPRFDIVMALIGGSLTGPLVFVLPPLMYSRARALRTASFRRSSAPELLYTGPEKHQVDLRNYFADPRIHSRSVHYSFRDGGETSDDGYSFTYYNDDDRMELDLYEELKENLLDDDEKLPRRYADSSEMTRSGSLPVMVDACRPSLRKPKRQEVRQNVIMNKPRKFFGTQRLIDWFGYCIVIIGIVITISSTYINIQNTVRYVQFTPPCIINASSLVPML